MLQQNPSLTLVPPAKTSAVIRDSQSYFENYARVVAQLPYADIEAVAGELHRAYQDGRNVFLFGNGGSAALASHFACDLGKGTVLPGKLAKRFRVLALTDNAALITAWANDTSYDQIFAEQLRNLVQPGDIAFAISGSGCSPNVLLALRAARESGAINIGLTGFKGGKMKPLCHRCMVIPSDNMQIIEDLQLGIAHALFTIVRHRIANTPATNVISIERSVTLPSAA